MVNQPEHYRLEQSDEEKTSLEMENSTLLHDESAFRRRRSSPRATLFLSSFFVFVIYSYLLVLGTLKRAERNRIYGARLLKSPADNYISYEPRVMRQWEYPSNVTYFTEPNEQVDRNWHGLFEYQNIGVAPDLMRKLGRVEEGIELPDGTYFGSLMVFHHLHCLKNLYHALHPEYYKLDKMTTYEESMWKEHTEHCLHMLKEAVMCQGDTTLLTMKWADTGARPIGNLTSPHECVNWDRLMEWVEPNSVDVFANGVLVHPKFGPVFVDGQFAEGVV